MRAVRSDILEQRREGAERRDVMCGHSATCQRRPLEQPCYLSPKKKHRQQSRAFRLHRVHLTPTGRLVIVSVVLGDRSAFLPR